MQNLERYYRSLERASESREALIHKFVSVRAHTEQICASLEVEDFVIQPRPEVSPPKWHLAHTTWFFEEFILNKFLKSYQKFDESYGILFNSYYKSAGPHWLQAERGSLSRPLVSEIFNYRRHVDEQFLSFITEAAPNPELDFLLEVGIQHEQQHQELLLMDIKSILSLNPSAPVYSKTPLPAAAPTSSNSWTEFQEGLYLIGHDGIGFGSDNEGPQHNCYLYPFAVQNQFVSNGEYLEFMLDGAYSTPHLWLSLGWDWQQQQNIRQPLYWKQKEGEWFEFTLHGLEKLDLNRPIAHISYFEADAFATWAEQRLPSEFELEVFFKKLDLQPQSRPHTHHPSSANQNSNDLWCWTKSQYSPYPKYKTFPGALAEYNGKFMCNQFVLRGGCIATPPGHYRQSYRNFYQPEQRWMFSGVRLAKDL